MNVRGSDARRATCAAGAGAGAGAGVSMGAGAPFLVAAAAEDGTSYTKSMSGL